MSNCNFESIDPWTFRQHHTTNLKEPLKEEKAIERPRQISPLKLIKKGHRQT